MQEVRVTCAVCGATAGHRCSACQRVCYCSREHQKSDWKNHAKDCQRCVLTVDAKLGRHYVATRDIEFGEIVLRDNAPLVTGPLRGEKPVCLSCYCDLTSENAKPCDKCGWPLCHRCTEHGAECAFTMKHRKTRVTIANYDKPLMIYNTVAAVRALALRDIDPKGYRKLLKTVNPMVELLVLRATNPGGHRKLLKKDDNHWGTTLNIAALEATLKIARYVRDFYHYDDVGIAEIARVVGIVQITGHVVEWSTPSHVAVYDKASDIEHDCRPNCSKSFTASGGIIVWAAIPISKGEHITTSYVDCSFSTMKRRFHLGHEQFFDCTCKRCQDPTEFGTMFSAFKCTRDDSSGCDGFMLPVTFTATDWMKTNFVCNKCDARKSWGMIEQMEARLNEKLAAMNDDLQAIKRFVERHSKIIHENHYCSLFADVGYIFVYYAGNFGASSHKKITEVMERCKKVVRLFEILQPAETRLRGKIVFIQAEAERNLNSKRKLNSDEVAACVSNLVCLYMKAYQLLRYESPRSTLEYQMAMHAWQVVNTPQRTGKFVFDQRSKAVVTL